MENVLQEYDSFLDEIKNDNPTKVDFINDLKNETNQQKIDRINEFYNCLEDESLFLQFSKGKLRVFSSKKEDTLKLSSSLFGSELTLKKIFNNLSLDRKDELWDYLRVFYVICEFQGLKRKDRLEALKKPLDKPLNKPNGNENKQMDKNDLFDEDFNSTTNSFLNDILNQMSHANQDNPIEVMNQTMQKISDKYKDQLNNGDIEMDKLFSSLQNKIPGMEDIMSKLNTTGKQEDSEPVIMDENFSTKNVKVGEMKDDNNPINIKNTLNLVNMLGEGDDNIMNLISEMNNIDENSSSQENKEKIEKIKSKMDEKLKSLGVNPDELNEMINKGEEQDNESEE